MAEMASVSFASFVKPDAPSMFTRTVISGNDPVDLVVSRSTHQGSPDSEEPANLNF
jgi:hypothetical protein